MIVFYLAPLTKFLIDCFAKVNIARNRRGYPTPAMRCVRFWAGFCRVEHTQYSDVDTGFIRVTQGIWFMWLEDIPQLILTMSNNLLLGSTLSWMQVTAPVLSTIMIVYTTGIFVSW